MSLNKRVSHATVANGFIFSCLLAASCTHVLSDRTDEQAWDAFDQEARSLRSPASAPSVHTDLLNTVPVRKILLGCSEKNGAERGEAEACFQNAVTLRADEFLRSKPSDYKAEMKHFLSVRTYKNVVDEVDRFHQSLLSGLDLKAREHARGLFQDCSSDITEQVQIENFDLLKGISFTMPKSVFACLSQKVEQDERKLLSETCIRLGLSIVSEAANHWILSRQIMPIYESEINAEIEKKAQLELSEYNLKKDEIFLGFDRKRPEKTLLKEWSPKLREKFPFSPVEQWITARMNHSRAPSSK